MRPPGRAGWRRAAAVTASSSRLGEAGLAKPNFFSFFTNHFTSEAERDSWAAREMGASFESRLARAMTRDGFRRPVEACSALRAGWGLGKRFG